MQSCTTYAQPGGSKTLVAGQTCTRTPSIHPRARKRVKMCVQRAAGEAWKSAAVATQPCAVANCQLPRPHPPPASSGTKCHKPLANKISYHMYVDRIVPQGLWVGCSVVLLRGHHPCHHRPQPWSWSGLDALLPPRPGHQSPAIELACICLRSAWCAAAAARPAVSLMWAGHVPRARSAAASVRDSAPDQGQKHSIQRVILMGFKG